MLKHTCIIGAVSEAMVIGYLGSLGCEVFASSQSHSRADLVYIDGDRTVKVQVKTSSLFPRGDNSYEQCRLVRKGINTPYTADEIDELWIVGTHLWCFPVHVLEGLTSITLGSTSRNPRKSVREYDPNLFIKVHGSLHRPYRERLAADDQEPTHFTRITTYSDLTQARLDRTARRTLKLENEGKR